MRYTRLAVLLATLTLFSPFAAGGDKPKAEPGANGASPRKAGAPRRLKLNDLAVDEPTLASPKAKAYALFCKGIMAEFQGDAKAAKELFEEALNLDPTAAEIHRALAEICAKAGDRQGFFVHAKKVVELDPASFDGHWALALYYEATRQLKEAALEYEQASKCQVDNPGKTDLARLKVAELYRELKNPKKALELCEENLKGNPRLPLGHRSNLLMGQIYLDMKDYAQAITRFKNCIALDLQAQDLATLLAYQGLTEVYVAQKKYDEAISFLKASARLTDQNFEVLRLLATVYEKAGRADDAITTYKSYTAASPQNTGALYLLAVFYEKAAKIQEAMDLYSKIIGAPSPAGVDNIRLLSYVNMSNIYVRQNRQADAIDLMTKAVAMVPERNWKAKLAQDLLLHLVFLYDTAGRGDEAETLLKKMLAADPDNPQANNYLGYFYADRGIHLDRAVELVNRALKVEPNSGAYLDSLAWALFKQAKAGGSPSLQDVLQKLLQAAERNKQEEGAEDPVILDHIAVVYFSLGQWEQAKARWTASLARAQELAKDRPNALPNIDQVRKLLDLVTTCLSEEERSRRLRLPLSQREQRTQR